MRKKLLKNVDITDYIEDKELIANKYILKSFWVVMLVYTAIFVLNMLDIFTVDKSLMLKAFIPTLLIYVTVTVASRRISLSNEKFKYFILSGIIVVFTITGVFLSYHAILTTLLPFLYATLYSSKKVMRYVYVMTVVSTIIVVYCGYFFGLCDANMVLLTTGTYQFHFIEQQVSNIVLNENPAFTLLLFFVIPRCLIYICFMAICNNIHKILNESIEKAELTEELEKAKTAAEAANKAKSEFLARMSHEIRTPINAVMGMNEIIIRESGEENIKQYAKDVQNSSEMLLSIINDILDSSKIESGMMEIVPVNYKTADLFKDLYNVASVKAREKNLEFIFDVAPDIPAVCFGDDKRIKQIFLNLLSNAVKYTHIGTVTLKVTCTREEEYVTLHCAVIDTGIGIKEEDIGKIYDAFQRIDLKNNRNIEGTGLGMSIVHSLLELMGSKINIKSIYGKGSEFSFDLRQKIVSAEEIGNFNQNPSDTAVSPDQQNMYRAPEAKVLIVDDFEMNIKVFKGLLKQTQIKITEATSGRECLNILKDNSFDIVFLDHMMPGMDGIETFRYIKENKLCEGTPIVMLTANAIAGEKEKYLAEGFNAFLSKPIEADKLDELIMEYIPEKIIMGEGETAEDNNSPEKIKALLKEKLSEEIDLDTAMATCSDDIEFYKELMGDFISLSVRDKLNQSLEQNNHDNYYIRIHGFKSNAQYVGATGLCELAAEMEKISKAEISDELISLQEQFLKQYDKICQVFKEILENQ